ncbi:MAG: PBSX family phage terminase large subunit [Oscillospiraceae bacterium]|nr:PBSX family phage terminase large subunit [Oscillospiraceae bacterium]
MTWWMPGQSGRDCDAVICDGAVRSGKTLAMGLGFFFWATLCFSGRRFALCGKTIRGVRRNLLPEVLPQLRKLGFTVTERVSENRLTVGCDGRTNDFYLFGGRDEGSASLIQGITLAGVLLDEVALMPRSFVEQACARCSVAGSRLWFNCNPEGPQHWFYREWIRKAAQRNCLYLHFTMADNPSLSGAVRARYERLYAGAFYDRYIRGLWTAAEGRVYDFFRAEMVSPPPDRCDRWYISCDYGTVNPASFGLWGRQDGVWYRAAEFYYDSRRTGRRMTDGEYADALARLAGTRRIEAVIVDPSAASFAETLRRRGYRVLKGKNDVLSGIRRTAELLRRGKLVLCDTCPDCLREMELYAWADGDSVRKEHDHAMDDMRYFAATVLSADAPSFTARAVARGGKENEET